MKNKLSLIGGIVCLLTGIVALLMNVSISSWGFYRFGHISTGGILLVILLLSIIYTVIKRNKIGIVLIACSATLMILSLILGVHMYIRHMSVFSMILIIGLMAVGIGLIAKYFLGSKA